MIVYFLNNEDFVVMYLGINNGFSILKKDNLVCYNYFIIVKYYRCNRNSFVFM